MNSTRYPSFGVLLVDDEPAFLRSLSLTLERGLGITHQYRCQDSREVPRLLAEQDIGLVLLDLTMPHCSGESLLGTLIEQHPQVCVIVISGLNQLETAVHCIKLGAFDYFVKTCEEQRLLEGVKRALQLQELRLENQALRHRVLDDVLEQPQLFSRIVTTDRAMRAVFKYLESVAGTPQPLLITGESGVGKELIAETAHALSRRPGALVTVNVAGLDDHVFADTLFGHSRGAFTGADRARAGLVEQAADGTLFLDEIGDLSPASQVKLLRLLQEGEYYQLGSDHPRRSRTRIIAATHQDLAAKQASGEFRRDLYYRLRIHQVDIPPLRKRPADLPLLLDHFLNQAAAELNKPKPAVPPALVQWLSSYHFPGNIRELRAMVYDAMSVHRSHTLSMEVFKRAIGVGEQAQPPEPLTERIRFHPDAPLPSLNEMGDLLVEEAMQRADGNQSVAARMLGISQPALSKRLKKRQ